MFYWEVQSLDEYWEVTLNALTWTEGYDLIFDDGGDLNLLIHEGKKVEEFPQVWYCP